MNTLKDTIAAFDKQKAENLPGDILQTMDETTDALKASGLEYHGLKTGDLAPAFSLSDHLGKTRRLAEYLEQGLLILSFYRGGWCPYCNMELNALQKFLPEIEQAGAKLVAVSPETPDNSLTTREKNALAFDVLFDQGNELARSFGLVFELPQALRPIYQKLGLDIPGHNGDETFLLPMPATYIIGPDATIRYHFFDADYTRRAEPAEVLAALRTL
jgi:peroxiredoxin